MCTRPNTITKWFYKDKLLANCTFVAAVREQANIVDALDGIEIGNVWPSRKSTLFDVWQSVGCKFQVSNIVCNVLNVWYFQWYGCISFWIRKIKLSYYCNVMNDTTANDPNEWAKTWQNCWWKTAMALLSRWNLSMCSEWRTDIFMTVNYSRRERKEFEHQWLFGCWLKRLLSIEKPSYWYFSQHEIWTKL